MSTRQEAAGGQTTMGSIRAPSVRWTLLLALIVGTFALASCTMLLPVTLQPATAKEPVAFRGGVFEPAPELPPFTLRRTDGTPFDASVTRGRVSLFFFFGYTYCPDVCPLTLSRVAEVRRQLGSDADKVDVYFVTVDPERDTPDRLAAYAAQFDPAIVPLTGTAEQLEQTRSIFSVVAERREVPQSAARYFMDHTAAIFLVDTESRIRLLYPHDAASDDVVADVTRLLSESGVTSAEAVATIPPSDVRVEQAWARPARGSHASDRTSAVYLVIRNRGDRDDTLIGAQSDAARVTEVHRSSQEDGVMRMRPSGEVVVPAGGTVVFEPGGLHLMLMGVHEDLAEGSRVQVTLRFAHAGEVTVTADVRSPEGESGSHN